MPELPLDKLFVLLFMMTGPLRVVPGFASLTHSLENREKNRLALRGSLYAAAGVILAVFLGHGILKSWGASPEALASATGLLLFLTALPSVLGWPAPTTAGSNNDMKSTKQLALSPLAFPIILPPFAVGILILFAAFFPDVYSQIKMVALALGLLAIDYVAMRFAHQILSVVGATTLQLLGAIFGVLQLSLAIQMMFWGLRTAFQG